MNTSRRNFLKGLFTLPLAGLLPKGQEPELPGNVEDLPESSEPETLPVEVEYYDYADSPYFMDNSMKAYWLDNDSGVSIRGDWTDIKWTGKIEED